MNRREYEMMRKGALPGCRNKFLIHAQLNVVSPLAVGDRDYVSFIPLYTMKLDISVAKNS